MTPGTTLANTPTRACTDPIKFLRSVHKSGDVFEIRAFDCPERRGGTFRTTASGYFNDLDDAKRGVEYLETMEPPGIFVSLNPVNPTLLARSCNRIKHKVKNATNDTEIIHLRNLLLDLDPVRPSGVSSTDAEMQLALNLADTIAGALEGDGWPRPLEGMSGNGAYLLYRLDLPCDQEHRAIVERVTKHISKRFSTDLVNVDTSTFNPSRMVKVLGTNARKGDDFRGADGVEPRPHRQSWFYDMNGDSA